MKLLIFFAAITVFSGNLHSNNLGSGIMVVLNDSSDEYVQLTLRNKSLKSIPLLIPGVMNPNLSPMSKSGVSLQIGQKILFKYNGKKHVLLEVTNELEGQTIEVSALLKEAKAQIDEM